MLPTPAKKRRMQVVDSPPGDSPELPPPVPNYHELALRMEDNLAKWSDGAAATDKPAPAVHFALEGVTVGHDSDEARNPTEGNRTCVLKRWSSTLHVAIPR